MRFAFYLLAFAFILVSMISLIKGIVAETRERFVVVDTGSIGYKVWVTEGALPSLKAGEKVLLWTYLAVRENSQDLYGFTSQSERNLFELLITVSGIGPKTALNILSLVSSETLIQAVRTGSVAHLVKVSGLGKKTAEKIVLELKDKLGGISNEDFGNLSAGMSSDADAIEALKALGYATDEAREVLKKIDPSIIDTGAKVKAALKKLS